MRLFLSLAVVTVLCAGERTLLKDGWAIESSDSVREGGEIVSSAGFQPKGWYKTTVPSSVVGALVANQVYDDPYFGMNLRSIPGATYPIGANFSHIPMGPDSPFRVPWWFRTEFKLPPQYRGKTVWLHFDGINYRANIWLNGRRVAASDKVAGAFRLYAFDVTGAVSPHGTNVLAVEVFPPAPNDLAITFVDWNPQPPDKNMGLWHSVSLEATGPVAVRHPHVAAKLDLPSLAAAQLTVSADLTNASAQPVKGTLKGSFEGIEFSQQVELAAKAAATVTFAPERFPQLKLKQPRIWWPSQVGTPNLYELALEFTAGGEVSDRKTAQFGVREVTSELTPEGHLLFKINGKNILIRGAGWTSDMLLRTDPERLEAEVRYVRDMNLNTIRLEGKLEDDRFYELTDRYGLLVMPGWCCCDHWEQWENWKPEDRPVAGESLKDQIRRLRIHPSVFVWLNGSDNPPPAPVEEMYIRILKELNWPNPIISSATEKKTTVTGESGMKMRGPYEYVAPSYWLLDKKLGGAYGFNTETGPGPSPPPLESLKKMLPASHLWPIDEYWNYHTGGGPFSSLDVFTEALSKRYGKPASVEDYAWKAQVQAYESHRAMFEGFGRNKYTSTGVIQWMLNNAWPSMIWHLYDYYLRPGGSYYGAKKGCEPLHIQYSYDDRSVVVTNARYETVRGLTARAQVYDFEMKDKFSKQAPLEAGPDSANRIFTIPEMAGLTGAYFVKLTLVDSSGKTASSNFYWLSSKPETLDWEKSTWYHTPTKTFADFTALQSLPKVKVRIESRVERRGEEDVARVTVENTGRSLAFFTHLKATKGTGGDEVLPVLWEDNYFPLEPGERREVTGSWRHKDVGEAEAAVVVDGWNVE